jgi:phage terminase large subunit GpA-like protein
MKNPTDLERLQATIARPVSAFRPPEDLTVSQWADKYRYLSPEASAEPGLWRTGRTPYLREVMDAFNDPKVRNIALVGASQVAKSECELNIIGYIIDQDPSSILYIHPDLDNAKKFSKMRVAPMIRDTKRLRTKVADVKSRDSGNTILQKSFPGGMLTMCGSNSAAALASMPIRYIIGDELDRWAASAGTEGDPWELAKARQITFYNAKSVAVSTPTVKNASKIESLYNQGTRERWHAQCPNCGAWHEIVFDNISFDYETVVIKNKKSFTITRIGWTCPSCACFESEAVMKKQPAKWIAENPAAYERGNRSFWLNAFSSPWISWEKIVLAFLEAQGDTKRLQVVFNTMLGELWEDRGDMDDEDTMLSRREEYAAELPDGVLCLTCGVDTQDTRLEYEVVGHGHFGETWGIKKGIIMGRPDTPEVWQQLDDVIEKEWAYKNGVKLRISLTFVDSGGHFTQEVYAACRERQNKKVFAVKGKGGDGIPFTAPPRQTKIVIDGKYIGQCWIYIIGVDAGKQLIMDSLRVKEPGAKYCHFPKNDGLGYDVEYFKGLISERLTYKNNRWVWEKIPGHERNEPLDCRNYALAAVKALSPNMDALEKRLKSAQEKKQPQPIRPPAPKKKRSAADRLYREW